ncbi:MAG: M20/M25/M40 family metallo-hydrolase [Bacteroidales bacterium]|nr:M20/M25/M40 family metallo-hydrolase [Bacteroidales bacterium]
MSSDADSIGLLRELVRTPSLSFGEEAAAARISEWLENNGISFTMLRGNIVASAAAPDPARKTLALIAHLDTVAPAEGYTRDPYDPGDDPQTVRGLGANDDGGSVVAMLAVLRHFRGKALPVNLLLLLVREEEVSGPDGVRWLFGPEGPFARPAGTAGWLPGPDWAIVGEPTGMRAATSERGLLVLDGEAVGANAHAARGDGVNALYLALDDIARLRSHHFTRISPEMGEVRLNVTQIVAGTAHNVIPDRCRFTVDIRPNECYTPQEILDELQALCKSRLKARNLLHRASATAADSVLRGAVTSLGLETFSSPTSSDWMQLPCDAVKIGPGDSARSHRADEYILVSEINQAIEIYIQLLTTLSRTVKGLKTVASTPR